MNINTDVQKEKTHNSLTNAIKKLKELKEQQKIEYDANPNKCLECGNSIEFKLRNKRKFCNVSCAAKYNNKNSKMTDETKLKISKSNKDKNTKNISSNRKMSKYQLQIVENIKNNSGCTTCLYCGSALTDSQILKGNQYCTYFCYVKNNNFAVNNFESSQFCEFCGKELTLEQKCNHNKFCSIECYSNNKPKNIKIINNKLLIKNVEYTVDSFIDIVKNSYSYSEICDKLNLTKKSSSSRKSIKKYITLFDINVNHFKTKNSLNAYKKSLEDILIKNSKYCGSSNLKKRLYNEGLLKPICSICGQEENWQGVKIALILDHINGINDDNRIENLRIVCPNCNAGLDTFTGKNTKKNRKKMGKDIDNISNVDTNEIIRPTYEQLKNEISIMGYKGVGEKYGVLDRTIRYWLIGYEKSLK